MKDGKNILITGGAGFIGQRLVEKFGMAGYDVCVLDIESPLVLTHGKYIKSDIFDFEKLTVAIENYDVIIHLVGLADARAAQTQPAESFRLNIASLQNLLEACRIDGNRRKLIFPSSAAIYGITKTLPVRESFTPHPTNVYSWHKCMCEEMIQCYHDNFALKYTILRLFNVYGRGNRGVMDLFLKKAARGETIRSFGLQQYRDFVYAGDVAEAFYKSAVDGKADNRTINIGSGKGTQIGEILGLICEIYPETRWVHEEGNSVLYDSVADITLAKKLLDYKPHASKEFMKKSIIKEMIEG